MTIKYSVSLPVIVTKIVLTGLMMTVVGVICPATRPSVPAAQDVDLKKLSACSMTEADFSNLPDNEQKRMLNELLKLNGGKAHQAFLDATKKGFLWAIAPLIKRGVLRASPEVGAALANAADKGHTEIVKLLLANGAPQNSLSLVMAAGKGHTEIVKLLIAAQTDQIIDNKLGGSALIGAIQHDHAEIVGLLLTAGVSPHGVDKNGMTHLMWASSQDNHAIVQLLLAAKADSTILSQNGKTALSCAAEYGHIDIVKELLATVAHSNIDICDNALRSAAVNGHSAIVKLLLAAQANVNSVDQNYGSSALTLAVEHRYIDIVKQLLAAGANPDVGITHDNITALMFTAMHDHPNTTGIIKLLLAARAHVDIVDHNGRSALMYAASFGHIFAIKELITTGANLDIVDRYGKTACAYAFSHDSHHLKMAPLFIDAYRQQLVNESCVCIQHINDSQTSIELTTLALNSDIKTAFEQLPAECSDLIMQRLPISSLGCIRQVSKACHAMVEFPLLIKALKEKIQRGQEEKLLEIVEKQIRQAQKLAQGDGEIEEQEQGNGGIEDQNYYETASSIIEQFGDTYDFWQAAITQQLAMQKAGTARSLRGMLA